MATFSQELFDRICERIAAGESLRSIDCDCDDVGGVAIYALLCPDTGDARYIGKADNAEARLKSHIRDMWRRDYPVYQWLRKLAAQGKMPEMVILWRAREWQDAERRLIEISRARWPNLLNVADGGEQPFCPDDVRSANGHALCNQLRANPDLAALRLKKAQLIKAAKNGYMRRDTMEKIKAAGVEYPKLFGSWAKRVEMVWRPR